MVAEPSVEYKKDKNMIDVVELCNRVLTRLSKMGYEKNGGGDEKLIFPNKVQAKGDIRRISEQELRFLFVEEFKKTYPELFYSIETPTVDKYKFGKILKNIAVSKNGQSALLDMCVFENSNNHYQRVFNIEFKHKNASIDKVGKDILKLINEEKNGAFIHLLNNTNSGTLCNEKETGVFNKLYKSFTKFGSRWSDSEKYVQIVILSLNQETLIHRKIYKSDLDSLRDIFFIDNGCGNILKVNGNGWGVIKR